MSDVKKKIKCDYCGAAFNIKFSEDLTAPQYCAFCGEIFEEPNEEIEDDEEDDGDLDYTDDEEKYA